MNINRSKFLIILPLILLSSGIIYILLLNKNKSEFTLVQTNHIQTERPTSTPVKIAEVEKPLHPMAIETLRKGSYPGSNFVVEKILPSATNYKQFDVSYLSEGLKIYGLLTVPNSKKPENGFPTIIFVHGYIPPTQYNTIKNYATYQPMLAKNGFITFKPDLRGHGRSDGEPVTAHFSEKYVVDVLNAISSIKTHSDVDPKRIGYWGHSNGAETGLRGVVISKDIKAASFWAGVVGSFEDLFETYNSKISYLKDLNNPLITENGLPSTNREFWNQLDPYFYLQDVDAQIQIQHATSDENTPVELSRSLKTALEKTGKQIEYYEYPGDNHNLTRSFNIAWQRTIDFFKKNL